MLVCGHLHAPAYTHAHVSMHANISIRSFSKDFKFAPISNIMSWSQVPPYLDEVQLVICGVRASLRFVF